MYHGERWSNWASLTWQRREAGGGPPGQHTEGWNNWASHTRKRGETCDEWFPAPTRTVFPGRIFFLASSVLYACNHHACRLAPMHTAGADTQQQKSSILQMVTMTHNICSHQLNPTIELYLYPSICSPVICNVVKSCPHNEPWTGVAIVTFCARNWSATSRSHNKKPNL